MTTRSLHDITVRLSPSLAVWPGDTPIQVGQKSLTIEGGVVTVSTLTFGSHAGTHVDAPLHFVPGGGSVDRLDLNDLIGPALVVEALDAPALTAPVLDSLAIPPGVTRLLFHTRNSTIWARGAGAFHEDYVGMTEDGARWVVERGIRLVGVDYLSVAPFGDGVRPHRVLLEAGVVVLEGLDLSGIVPAWYQLLCLPLKIEGGDGAPARVVLMDL